MTMAELNVLDWIIAALLMAAAVVGYRRGFITQLVSLAGLVLSYIIAYTCYAKVAPWLGKLLPLSTFEAYDRYEFAVKVLHLDEFILNAISFALLFFGVKLALTFVSRILTLVASVPGLNGINRWAGLVLAVAETLLLIVIAVNVMSVLPADGVQEMLATSRTAHWFMEKLPADLGKLQQLWNDGTSGKIKI